MRKRCCAVMALTCGALALTWALAPPLPRSGWTAQPGAAQRPPGAKRAASVVINEVLYHAPDHLDDLRFIELHNTTDKAVDLAGWKLTRDVRYTFPAKAKIEANGYLV